MTAQAARNLAVVDEEVVPQIIQYWVLIPVTEEKKDQPHVYKIGFRYFLCNAYCPAVYLARGFRGNNQLRRIASMSIPDCKGSQRMSHKEIFTFLKWED
jgi:hypothetical protein